MWSKYRHTTIGNMFPRNLKPYLKSQGIRHELTTPYSPQQNGVAERMNCTLMEAARCMIAQAKLSDRFWAEAVATAAYLRDRMPTLLKMGC